MNRRVIIFIIGLMTIALLGLVAVQVYWIKNAMTVRHANFVRSVNEAVDGVTFRIEKRLSYDLLESLLKDELHKKSISANFQFGVFSTRREQMLMKTEGSDPVTLIEKGYAFILFPENLVREPDYLMLYFPNERGFLIKQIAGLLVISISLILIIIFSFIYTVFTIYRQKRLSEIKNDFINNMTHEFKTPISTISLACQALKDKDVSKSEAIYDSYIGIIGEENLRLGAMAEKILQSAVLDKKQLELKKEWFDIHEVITDVVNKIGIQVQIKDGRITTNFRANPSDIYADRVHITNLVNNLLDNANKYTPQKPLIRVSTDNVGTGIMISIEDNGIGVSKKNQKKIFDKLFRVPMGDLHDFKGFGLGLSYVKAIVEYHKGNISLESEIKKGTKFDVFLPYES